MTHHFFQNDPLILRQRGPWPLHVKFWNEHCKYVFFLDPSLCATCNKGPLKSAFLSLLGHCKNQVLLKKYTCIVKKNVKVLLFEFCPFSNINTNKCILNFVSVSAAVTTINAILGSTVTLECPNEQNQKITWWGPYKGNAIYAEATNINTNLPEDLHSRLFITIDNDTNEHQSINQSLRIVDVRISDQGTYTCSNDTTGTNQIEFNLVLPGKLSYKPDWSI